MKKLILMSAILLIGKYGFSETEKSVKLEIEQLQEKIKEERLKWAGEKSASEKDEKKRISQLADLESQKLEFKDKISGSELEIEHLLNEIEKAKSKTKRLETSFEFYNKIVLEEAGALKDAIANSIPVQLSSRMEKINTLILDLKKNKINPEEALTRLWGIYSSEEQMASEALVYSGKIKDGSGTEVPVKYLRVGKQIAMYSNASGIHVGVLRKIKSGEWKWLDENELDSDERKAVKKAVEVADGKALPGFTSIPLLAESLELIGDEENKNE